MPRRVLVIILCLNERASLPGRVELRSIARMLQVGLLQERLGRMAAQQLSWARE